MFALSNYKDVDETVGAIINKFYELRNNNKYDEAYQLLQENESILKPYHISANSFNKIELGIYDLARQQFYAQKTIVSDTEPEPKEYEMNVGSEWLQKY